MKASKMIEEELKPYKNVKVVNGYELGYSAALEEVYPIVKQQEQLMEEMMQFITIMLDERKRAVDNSLTDKMAIHLIQKSKQWSEE